MHDKKRIFFEAADYLGFEKKNVLTTGLFFAPSYRSSLIPNITLRIHNTYHSDIKIVSVVDESERTLFYRTCNDRIVISAFNLLKVCNDIRDLLDGLEILTYPNEPVGCKS